MTVARGRLVTIEGIDGAGKTTLAAALREALAARGVDVARAARAGRRRAGGAAAGDREGPRSAIGARAEALLYAASRAQLVEELVAPALAAGRWVLLDRYVDSSLAYQGAGRGLGTDAVGAINAFGTGELAADRTLLLAIDPAAGRERRGDRGAAPDRLEREADDFFAAIAAAYDELAAAEPERFRALDASAPPERVLAEALAELADLL